MNALAALCLSLSLAAAALPVQPGASKTSEAPLPRDSARSRVLRGTVLEALDAGAYTYLRIKTDAGEEWAAVGKTALKAGDKAAVGESTVMEDFESPTLKRRFKKVVFGVLERPAAPAAPAQAAKRPAGPAVAVSVGDAIKRRKELAGRLVRVTGRVVKYNAGILGRNWLHLQDGKDDLTVTTTNSALKGATLSAEGILVIDRDFGSGYSYPVLLEDAALTPR